MQSIDNLLESSERGMENGTLTAAQSVPTEMMNTIPHEDESTWQINCARVEAERKLQGRPDGTFLIRPSSSPGSYALSVV